MKKIKDTSNSVIQTYTIVWAFLILLIVSLYLFSEAGFGTSMFLFISVIKFLLVGFFFMEVRNSHIVWKLVLILFAVIFSFSVYVLN